METAEIPGADLNQVPGVVQAEFGRRPLDEKTNAELNALEQAINNQFAGKQPQAAPAPVVPVPEPLAQVQAPPPEVPKKFQTPEGNLDDGKLNQSLANLEAYLQAEKELTKLRQPQQPQYAPQPPSYPPYNPAYPQYPPQIPIEQRVNQDLQSDPGATVINLMRAAVAESESRAKAQNADLARKLELMEIGRSDPGVFTQAGVEALRNTLRDNPWILDSSPTPWTHAYKLHGPISKAPQGQAPAYTNVNPIRPSAPVLPGGQAPQGFASTPVITDLADLRRHLVERFPNDPMKQANFLEKVMLESEKRRRG